MNWYEVGKAACVLAAIVALVIGIGLTGVLVDRATDAERRRRARAADYRARRRAEIVAVARQQDRT